uniref:Synaptobrevin, longin-like domain protein n=1 Tax=Tanacetum cinerariifolium TaxID=118510 RepID=A0A6L2NJE6_TANCI|nr:hypothetical protein [Tanacetum cinerariifolium]
MVVILEKGEHNIDFHLMVDFIEVSPLRYALTVKPTVYVSHIRQFWSTARIETTEEGTKILVIVDGIVRTVSESSLRRNLKLRDEEEISSLPDTELFKNLTLMGYNISPNQKFTFQKGFNEFSSNIATALVCLATNRTYNFSKMIFDGLVKNVNNKISKFLMYPRFLTMYLRMSQFAQTTHTHTYVVPFHTRKLFTTLRVNSPSFSGRIVPLFDTMLVQRGEGSGTPTEPHHTPSHKASSPSHTTHTSQSLPPLTTTSIPTVTPTETTPIRQYTRRARIAQYSALPTVADEPASPHRDVSQGEACPTDSGFIADQDRATIAKSFTLPHDSAPRVTSPAAVEGSMQQTIPKLTALCAILQMQLSELTDKFQTQEVEINQLKARVKLLEEREGLAFVSSRDDAPIKGMTTVLASGVVDVSTTSGSIPTASIIAEGLVPTGNDVVSTASSVFATATMVTPVTRRKGKEVIMESETLKKQKVQEQIDAQVARELEEQLEREDHRRADRIARDAEVARIHIEEELQKLPIERRVELISDLVKYQDNYAKIYKYQSQQRKPMTKKQKRDYYMVVIRNNLGWKVKDFKSMTFEKVEAKFNSVWKQIEDFIPMGSKEETERFKRKGISFAQESAKKQKTSEEVTEEAKSPDEVSEEKVKEMMQLIHIEDVYVEALQVKHPIVDWQHLDKEDLNQLWRLVKETLSNRPPTSDKEMELWVELNRMYEPDKEDQMWTHTQNFMHAPVDWKLYDSCGVHHVTSKDKKIFMLVEKDYPLRKGLALVMICYKLQVDNFSQMANDLVLKIYKIANSPRQQGD